MPDDSKPEAPQDPSTDAPAPADVGERPLFRHPQWMLGVVLIFAVAAIVAGMSDPVWFVIGAPCILVLIVYVWVRLWGGGRP